MISILCNHGTVPVLCNGAIQSLLYVSVWSLSCVTLPYKHTFSSGHTTPNLHSCAIWTPSYMTVPYCHCPVYLCHVVPILSVRAIWSMSHITVTHGPHPAYLFHSPHPVQLLLLPHTPPSEAGGAHSRCSAMELGCPQWAQCCGTGVPSVGAVLWDCNVHGGSSDVGLGCSWWVQCQGVSQTQPASRSGGLCAPSTGASTAPHGVSMVLGCPSHV